MRKNELALRSEEELSAGLARIWQTMTDCIQRGQYAEGLLPGPLKVPRRACSLRRTLEARAVHDPMEAVDWVNLFALAVNEENAAGGRVVTAPTNGACGIVPAVLAYYDKFVHPLNTETIERYLLATGAIGALYKMNASISGAEVGCQGEVGVACSMAAAGLTEIMGGTPEQVCMAAEIGMEHNLGLTCDPVGGQVQIPCIERNRHRRGQSHQRQPHGAAPHHPALRQPRQSHRDHVRNRARHERQIPRNLHRRAGAENRAV